MDVNGDTGLVKLICSVQNYDWGRIGYLFEGNCGGQIDDKKHYAEFWMGTHVSWLLQNPKVLSDVVVHDLPFLLKAHPDKELAEDATQRLQGSKALALTHFQRNLILCLKRFPRLANACVDQHNGKVKEDQYLLRSVFTKLMSVDRDVISKALSKLVNRPTKENETRQLSAKEELVLKLEKQYPNDVGVPGPSVFVVISGEGMMLTSTSEDRVSEGDALFAPAGTEVRMYRAGVNNKLQLKKDLDIEMSVPVVLVRNVTCNEILPVFGDPWITFPVQYACVDAYLSFEIGRVLISSSQSMI